MKPSSMSVVTQLAVDEIKRELNEIELAADRCSGIDDLDAVATGWRNITDVAVALENITLTAIGELEQINAAVAESLALSQ